MSSKGLKAAVAGLALLTSLGLPSRAGAVGMVMAGPGASAGASAGAAVGGGGAAFGGGSAFGNAPGRVTPGRVPFNSFPFFGGGSVYGGPIFNVSQPFVVPPPILPQETQGPMQIMHNSPFARPVATGSRQVFVEGVPTTVTGPVIMEYNWPATGVAAKKSPRAYMRTKLK